MLEFLLQTGSDAASNVTIVDHLIGSWYIWAPIIGILIFFLKAGTNFREWRIFIKEIKEDAEISKTQKK
ncbi:hypothetical protein [Nitrosopumilus sp.]|uniref:hypothetical protein n=1 Tax=Nitrosopumilus sp. TaxID=2024843 RepID=UPI003D0BDFDC